jgi:TP901 family phage tail tape measure protein
MTQKIGLEAVFEDKAFNDGMDRYNRAIDNAVNKTTSGASSMGSQFAGLGSSVLGVAGLLGGALVTGAGAAGAAMTAFVVSGVKAAADFEAQLDGIQAVLGATQGEIGQLNDLIINLGLNPNLKVDATQAADAIEMLARNGLSATEILEGAAEATVLLANATGAEFSTAANVSTDAMAIFNIEASNMIEAVNGITSVTTGSKFGIEDYALALAQAGGVAATVGVGFDDFNTSIAAMSPLFASGSDAGTSFKTMLMRLIPQTDKAQDMFNELGLMTYDAQKAMEFLSSNGVVPVSTDINDLIDQSRDLAMSLGEEFTEPGSFIEWATDTGILTNSFYDANGQLKDMGDIAVILNQALSGLSEEQRSVALNTIFGSDAMRAAAGLMDSGAIAYTDAATAAAELGVSIDDVNQFIDGGITKYEALMLQMQQTDAVESAATRMDNLAGAMEILGGIFDAIKLQVGQAFLPLIRQVVDEVSAFLSENQDAIIGFFNAIATGISTFVTAISEGESPITAFFDALGAAGVPEDTITSIQDIVTKIQDFIDKIVVFVNDHAEAFKGAITGIGAVLGASVIVAIISGIGAALAALASPITLIIGAAALLGAAWSENWFGIRDTVTEAWNDLQPTFQTVKDWLETNIPVAIDTVTTAFNNISTWFNDNKQTILDFVDSVITPVKEAWQETGTAVGDLVSDQFAKVGAWFQENKPLIEDFAKVIGTVLVVAAAALAKAWSFLQVQLAGFVRIVAVPFLDGLVTHFLNVATLIMQIVTGDWAGAWETVKTIVSDSVTNLISLLGSLVDWIAGWFGSSLEEIGTVWSGIWDNITAILGLAWENIKTVISSAWLTIQTIWDAAVSAVVTGWTAFWDGLFLTVSTIWTAIVTFITDAITNFTTGWNAFWDGLFLTVSTIWTAIVTFITDAITNFTAAWNAFWDGLKLTVDTIWEAIKTFIIDTITGLFEGMGISLDDMKERWATIWADVQLIVQTVWNLITTWISEKVNAVKTVITDVVTAIQSWWDTTWNAISTTASTIWTAITTAVSTAVTAVQTTITTIVTAIQTWWDTTWNAISTTASTIWTAITTAVSTAITTVQTTINTIVTAIQTWWDTTWTAIQTAVETVWASIVTAVSERVNDVKSDVETTVGEVKTWWETTWNEIKTKVTEIWTEIVTAVGDKLEEVRTAVEEKVTAVKTWIGDQVEAFKQVGNDIITGLKDGILEAGGAVIEAITGVVEDAISWAKQLLGIASPSKEFEEIGIDVIAGMVMGIIRSRGEIEGAMDAAIGPILQIGEKFGSFGGAMADRFKKDVLDPMKDNLDGLEDEVKNRENKLTSFQEKWAEQMGMTRDELLARLPQLTLDAVRGGRGGQEFLRNLEIAQSLGGQMNDSQAELNAATKEYEAQQQRLLDLEKQRQDLAFLRQQLDFLEMIRDAGLDPQEILGGLELGLDADLPGLIDAMSNAVSAMVNAANNELQIASPSKVFRRIGEMVIKGMADGVEKARPLLDAFSTVSDAVTKEVADSMSAAANIPNVFGAAMSNFNRSIIPPLQSATQRIPAPVVNVDAAAPTYQATFNTRSAPVSVKQAVRLLELSHA